MLATIAQTNTCVSFLISRHHFSPKKKLAQWLVHEFVPAYLLHMNVIPIQKSEEEKLEEPTKEEVSYQPSKTHVSTIYQLINLLTCFNPTMNGPAKTIKIEMRMKLMNEALVTLEKLVKPQ